jgi:hypothetical protein
VQRFSHNGSFGVVTEHDRAIFHVKPRLQSVSDVDAIK